MLAPLPARKLLWEANDQYSWNTERERGSGAQADFGMALNGDLVRIGGDWGLYSEGTELDSPLGMKFSPRGTASWEDWCSGMDGLGGLVLLAAALIT